MLPVSLKGAWFGTSDESWLLIDHSPNPLTVLSPGPFLTKKKQEMKRPIFRKFSFRLANTWVTHDLLAPSPRNPISTPRQPTFHAFCSSAQGKKRKNPNRYLKCQVVYKSQRARLRREEKPCTKEKRKEKGSRHTTPIPNP